MDRSHRGGLCRWRARRVLKSDLITAAEQLPDGLILDGELVVWSRGRLSFEALQRRASSGGRSVGAAGGGDARPLIAFDVLQEDGQELLDRLTNEQLGNFPQAFTHVALIVAALALDDELDRAGH